MRKLIRVTPKHIDNGEYMNPRSCPVALAIKEAFPLKFPYVAFDFISLKDDDDHFKENSRCSTPKVVQEFIDKFDRKEKVKPFKFYLNVK